MSKYHFLKKVSDSFKNFKLQNYYQAAVQQEQVLTKVRKEKEADESHEETVQKLHNLESKMQSGEDLEALNTQQEQSGLFFYRPQI